MCSTNSGLVFLTWLCVLGRGCTWNVFFSSCCDPSKTAACAATIPFHVWGKYGLEHASWQTQLRGKWLYIQNQTWGLELMCVIFRCVIKKQLLPQEAYGYGAPPCVWELGWWGLTSELCLGLLWLQKEWWLLLAPAVLWTPTAVTLGAPGALSQLLGEPHQCKLGWGVRAGKPLVLVLEPPILGAWMHLQESRALWGCWKEAKHLTEVPWVVLQ